MTELSDWLYNFHVSVLFYSVFSCNWSSLTKLWFEKILDIISIFLFTEAWFVTQDVVYPGEYSMCTGEESIFFCIWMECPEDIN